MEANRTKQVLLGGSEFAQEFVEGQIAESCILGFDFLQKCGAVADLAAGVLWGSFGEVKLLCPTKKEQDLVWYTCETNRQHRTHFRLKAC